jgi:hypothetical protein
MDLAPLWMLFVPQNGELEAYDHQSRSYRNQKEFLSIEKWNWYATITELGNDHVFARSAA